MKTRYSLLLLVGLLALSGCNNKNNPSSSSSSSSSSTSSTAPVFDPNENLASESVLFDDFSNGIDINVWEIANTKWGNNNNGVIKDNVHYTSDGILVLQANGDNYDGPYKGYNSSSGKRTGAALISNEAFGPGRFEARMKALPRFGATTAFWTFYYNDKLSINHEIDIELNVNNDFRSVWTTNWTTLNDSDHYEATTDIVHNDGEWHVYKFEWHTNPMRIDYYIDDILIKTSFTNIPTYAGKLWIGNWFPDGWAGTPDFETDYTLVDYIRYTPYINNPYTPTEGGRSNNPSHYPTEPITLPKTNLISNPGFEGLDTAWRKEATSKVKIEAAKGIDGSKAIYVPSNEITYQYITGLDNTFELVLKANAKLSSSSTGGYILVEYRPLETKLLGTTKLEFTPSDSNFKNDEYYYKEIKLTLPTGTKRIELSLIGNDGGGLYLDDLYLNLTKKS
jgi:hypothetical protein